MTKILLALVLFLIPSIASAEILEITVQCDKPTFAQLQGTFNNVSTDKFGYKVVVTNDGDFIGPLGYYYENEFVYIPIVVKGKKIGDINVPARRGCVYSTNYNIIAVRQLEIIE